MFYRELLNKILVFQTLMNQDFVSRYSRQLILNDVSVSGQLRIKNASVLIVGAGGLGCPVALYLAAAGVGHLGIIDHDVVEVSNLHRQVAHGTDYMGKPKVNSLSNRITALNPTIKLSTFQTKLDSSNVLEIMEKFGIVADCSDNAPTRYLVSDATVVLGKTLVSCSALRWEGQLSVFKPCESSTNPCYRCIYPVPPEPELTGSCSEMGVMGFVCGVMGSLQAQETIKEILGKPQTLLNKLLLYDGSSCLFRTIKLRSKDPFCVCSTHPKMLSDFEPVSFQVCQSVKLLSKSDRLTASQYSKLVADQRKHLVLDVRRGIETEICKYNPEHSIFVNIPLQTLSDDSKAARIKKQLQEELSKLNDSNLCVVMCKRGNDSQKAVVRLRDLGLGDKFEIKDLIGGLFNLKTEIKNSDLFLY